MKPLLDVIVVTYDNVEMLMSALHGYNQSIQEPLANCVHYWVVNNGKAPLKNYIGGDQLVTVLEPGENLGWEGGLKYALERTKAPFVLFSNDDIRPLQGANDWMWKMLNLMNDPSVGAVGPSSNYVMGPQNIFNDSIFQILDVKYLIGFCMLVRRDALEKAGGVDTTLPGGDDIDLSIRLRDAGYRLLCRRDCFVYHHGSVTGNRLQAGYWNSDTMQEKTNMALIRKHGMFKFWETLLAGWQTAERYDMWSYSKDDIEGMLCSKYAEGDKVLELGCGGRKTVPHSIGVDMAKKGAQIPFVSMENETCIADIQADVSSHLPFDANSQDTIIARHILEHCQDPLGTMAEWNAVLKPGGKLIIAVPDPTLKNTILMNPEHIISFSPSSLNNMAACCGFRAYASHVDVNHVSFVSVYEKVGDPYFRINKAEKTQHPLAAAYGEVAA